MMHITYEGFGGNLATYDAAALIIGGVIVALLAIVWINAPKMRKEFHKVLHDNKPKVEGWLKDPDYYKKNRP